MSIPVLTLRQSVQFPANVYGDNGIDVSKANGNYTIKTDWSDFAAISSLPASPTNNVLTFDTLTGAYVLVPSAVFGGGAPAATIAPIMDGTAAVGIATKYAREDHVHPSDISRAATVHTHIAANITDFSEAVDDRVGALLTAGPNVTLSYNDTANTLTISASGSGGGGGDVTGPSSSVADRIALFSGTTGKVIKDGGTLLTGLQPIDADLTAIAALSGTGIARRTATTPTWTTGDPVANAELATMAASTLKANVTGGTATPTDATIVGLTTKSSPTTSDWLLISDTAASGAFKKAAWPVIAPSALTKSDDTNVTLTLGGASATALLGATSITAGWTGTLAASRGGFGTSVSAATGVPLFAAGVPTFTSTSGSGNFVRVGGPTLTGMTATGTLQVQISGSVVAAIDIDAQDRALTINQQGVGTSVPLLFSQSTPANVVGSITTTTTSTTFNTVSDARLKEDLQAFDAGRIVDNTDVYDFAWKSTGERSYGVLAQQAVDIYPAAVTHIEKEDWWGINYQAYVPILLQELKALRARVAQLEAVK
jgi:hypothetical protein